MELICFAFWINDIDFVPVNYFLKSVNIMVFMCVFVCVDDLRNTKMWPCNSFFFFRVFKCICDHWLMADKWHSLPVFLCWGCLQVFFLCLFCLEYILYILPTNWHFSQKCESQRCLHIIPGNVVSVLIVYCELLLFNIYWSKVETVA